MTPTSVEPRVKLRSTSVLVGKKQQQRDRVCYEAMHSFRHLVTEFPLNFCLNFERVLKNLVCQPVLILKQHCVCMLHRDAHIKSLIVTLRAHEAQTLKAVGT